MKNAQKALTEKNCRGKKATLKTCYYCDEQVGLKFLVKKAIWPELGSPRAQRGLKTSSKKCSETDISLTRKKSFI